MEEAWKAGPSLAQQLLPACNGSRLQGVTLQERSLSTSSVLACFLPVAGGLLWLRRLLLLLPIFSNLR